MMGRMHAARTLKPGVALMLGLVVGAAGYGTLAAGQDPPGLTADERRLLHELAAKDAIREQIYNYARGLDRMDKALAAGVWHPDGTADYIGAYEGTGAGFVDWVWPVHEPMTAHSHQMTNILIEVDGDTAVSEAYAMVSLHTQGADDGAVTSFVRSRYADTWSQRDGRWAIDHRIAITDFRTAHEATGPRQPTEGSRDRTDPSYAAYPF